MEISSDSSSKKQGVLARNTAINLIGRGLPLIFAVIAIPFVIKGLGTERFGVLTIVWMVIGYFGLFDMGIGRATTKFVADLEARGASKLSPIIITSILLLGGLGIAGGAVIWLTTPYLVYDILNIPDELLRETEYAFHVLSFSIPLVLGSIGARGALEAQQKFGIVNAIKVPAGIINYVGPLMVLPFSNQLQHVVIVLVAARVITFGMYLYFCLRDDFTLELSEYPVVQWAKEMLSFGAWVTVSNLISPIMVYMDRFILGAILTMSAVAYYTTPYEMISRLLIVSSSFMGVMFPAFSVYSKEDSQKMAGLHQKSIRYLLLILTPIVTFLIITAEPLLFYWIGSEFAQNSTVVLQLLAIGILVNSVATVPYTALQAAGRPDITAKLHLLELPVYLLMIWFFTYWMGVVGVALAWVLRVSIDGVLLLYFCNNLISFMDYPRRGLYIQAVLHSVAFGFLALIFFYIQDRLLLVGFGIVSALLIFYLIWTYTLKPEERSRLMNFYQEVKSEASTVITSWFKQD